MLQLLLKSHLSFLLIPIITLALEPSNPAGLCDRFLGEQEKTACSHKTSVASLDWYAASACALQQDDKNFMSCLDEIKGSVFNPQALELCAKASDETDQARMSCLRKLKNKDFTRLQLKKCSELSSTVAIETCLSTNSSNRTPASAKKSGQVPPGFQSLEIPK
jgi:hypothetical protein